jgi:hypothetical protein
MEIKVGGKREGTFVHPKCAIHIGMWASNKLTLYICEWVSRYIAGDPTLTKDVQARVDEVHGTKSLLTHTMVDKEESDVILAETHKNAAQYQTKTLELQAELRKTREAYAEDQAKAKKLEAEFQKAMKANDALGKVNDGHMTMIKIITSKKDELDKVNQELTKKTSQNSKMIDDLVNKLQLLGVSEETDVSYLLVQQQRKRRRRQFDREQLKVMSKAGNLLQETLLQRESETGVHSMPARFLALRNINESTNGKKDKIAHALIKDTLACMGENLMKYVTTQRPSRPILLGAVAAILNEVPKDDSRNRMNSNVFITNFLCGNIKRILNLKHATYMTVGQLYWYVYRFNKWAFERQMNQDFRLVQQEDLERVLGYEKKKVPVFPVYNPCDIRQFFRSNC